MRATDHSGPFKGSAATCQHCSKCAASAVRVAEGDAGRDGYLRGSGRSSSTRTHARLDTAQPVG